MPHRTPLAETPAATESRWDALEIVGTVHVIAPDVHDDVSTSLGVALASMDPAASLPDRLDALVALAGWLRERTPLRLPENATVGDGSGAGRVWLLVEVLRAAPAWRARAADLVARVLLETTSLRLFARTGLPSELRIFSEFADRVVGRLLPRPPEHGCLAALTARIFPDARSTHWLEAAPPQLVADLAGLLVQGRARSDAARARIVGEAAEALALLAVRAASLGLDDDIRSRSALARVGAAPVLALARAAAEFLEARRRAEAGEPGAAAEVRRLGAEAAEHVAGARAVLEDVAAHMDAGGVSVDLVFRIELLGRLLDRADQLLALLEPDPEDPALQRARAVRFFRALVAASIVDRSLLALVQGSSRLLARRIIERAGETGEHYITSSRAEWQVMLRSAVGGGFVMVGTGVVKFSITAANFPYFFQAAFYGLNYATSFVALQLLGFTLATKQPSVTAATIAANVEQSGRGGLEPLVDLIARTLRSQLAAFIGNLATVVPTALGVHFVHLAWTGEPLLDAETAAYVIATHHPTESGTLFYAVLTGVLLWFSSILGGWVENWSALNRLPEAIAAHRGLTRWFGAARARALSRGIVRHAAGLGSNVSLGFMLGAAPIVGKFFGAPVDVRHVTLSTGAITFAGAAVGPLAVVEPPFREAVAAIVLVGMLNLLVSFTLALAVALRARNVPLVTFLDLARAVALRFLRSPTAFLYPPADAPPSADHGHAHGGAHGDDTPERSTG